MKPWTPFAGAIPAALLAGCIAIPADRGAATMELLKTRSDVVAGSATGGNAHAEVAQLLAAPMNAEAAVRVALLQAPRMRALYARLGFAQADIYDASRLSNPALGYLRLDGLSGGGDRTTWSLSQSFTELLFLSYRTRVGRNELLQAQQTVASEILDLEAEVRSAYYEYVSASRVAQMRERVKFLTNTAAQYAQQLFEAGNINALQLSREQAMASAAGIEQRSAAIAAQAALGSLMKLLGLKQSPEQAAQFIVTLPLPAQINADLKTLQEWALAQRLDLHAMREQVSLQNMNVAHTRRWRWLGGLQGVAEYEREAGNSAKGLGAELELPLFNQGGGKLLRAQAGLASAQANLAGLETAIGNDVILRRAALQAAYENVEEYRQRLVPLRERIVTLSQQQQTFMLIGTFELLSAKQQEMDTYQAYLEAVRDYWIAYAELRHTLGGKLPADINVEDHGISVGMDAQVTGADEAAEQSQEIDHSQHHMHTTPAASGEAP